MKTAPMQISPQLSEIVMQFCCKSTHQGPTNPRGGWCSSHVTPMDLHHRQGLSGRPGPPKHSHTSEEMHISPRLSEIDMQFRCKTTPRGPPIPPECPLGRGVLMKYPPGLDRPGSGNNSDFRNPTRLRAGARNGQVGTSRKRTKNTKF